MSVEEILESFKRKIEARYEEKIQQLEMRIRQLEREKEELQRKLAELSENTVTLERKTKAPTKPPEVDIEDPLVRAAMMLDTD